MRSLSFMVLLVIGCGPSREGVVNDPRELAALEREAHRLSNQVVERGRSRNTDGFGWLSEPRSWMVAEAAARLHNLKNIGQTILSLEVQRERVLAWRRYLDADMRMRSAFRKIPETKADFELMIESGAELWNALTHLRRVYGWEAASPGPPPV